MIAFFVMSLPRDQITSYVACLVGGGELLERTANVCAATEHFRFGGTFSLSGTLRLITFLKQHQIDVIHTYGLRADTAGRLAAKIAGVPVIISGIRSTDPWRKWYHTILDRLTAPLVDLFISNSEAGKLATVAREKFAPERIEVVYSGFTPATTSIGLTNDLEQAITDAHPVVAVLANIREMKGHVDLIHALPALISTYPKLKVVFAGRDDSNGEISALARATGVIEHIVFPGYIRDTTALLARADVFCLPSHWEGLPVSILEAMFARTPIVTTDVGGIPELVRDECEALLVRPGDPAALSEAFMRLFGNKTFASQLAEKAYVRTKNLFSEELMVNRHLAIYRNLWEAKTKRQHE